MLGAPVGGTGVELTLPDDDVTAPIPPVTAIAMIPITPTTTLMIMINRVHPAVHHDHQ